MNVLPILDADFAELCFAVAEGRLAEARWSFQPRATVCKYVVPAAYPEKSSSESLQITPSELADFGADWFWAACEKHGDDVVMTPSRTGAFVGIGDSLSQAEAAAERACQRLEQGRPIRHRHDIGTESLVRKRIEHMRELRGVTFRPRISG